MNMDQLAEDVLEAEPKADRREQSGKNRTRRTIFGVPVYVTISIGRQKVKVSDLLDLKEDSIVPLQAKIDDPVELIVEGQVIAIGELIETDDGAVALRITEIPEQPDV